VARRKSGKSVEPVEALLRPRDAPAQIVAKAQRRELRVFFRFAMTLSRSPSKLCSDLMDFDAWTTRGSDPIRQKRLAVGYTIGSIGAAAVVTLVALTAAGIVQPLEQDEQILDVQLATEPEPEPEPELAPEPEPEPEPEAHPAPPRPGPVMPAMVAPTEVPDDTPAEAAADSDNPYGAGDPYAYGAGSAGTPEPKRAVVEPPPPPPPPAPKPQGPIRITENVTPPSPVAMPHPPYPAEAKAAGVEGTVVVRFVVAESGAVLNVQAIRGPADLRAICEATVRTWRFSPARLDGQPVSVIKTAPFRFRLRT
jgi:periplasmic protein TonB